MAQFYVTILTNSERGGDTVNCPYCNKEMEKGYIDQADFKFPLEWYPARCESGFLQTNKRNIKLTSAIKGVYSLVAYYCSDCKNSLLIRKTPQIKNLLCVAAASVLALQVFTCRAKTDAAIRTDISRRFEAFFRSAAWCNARKNNDEAL